MLVLSLWLEVSVLYSCKYIGNGSLFGLLSWLTFSPIIAAKQPGNVSIEQHSPTTMRVSWTLSSAGNSITEFRIYYSSDNNYNNMIVSLPPLSQVIIENLQHGATYHVSIVALSVHLPSLRTPTVDITLGRLRISYCVLTQVIVNL